jgi:hypothetical protein
MSAANYTHVVLVVDPEFGRKAKRQAELGPLWVIKSPQNTSVIEELWAAGSSRFINSPACFDAVPGRSLEDSAEICIGTVHDHHPEWRVFEIVGTPPTERLLDALRECAAGSVRATATGFEFVRDQDAI